MSTKTRVINLIEDIVTAADMPLTRGDVNALATAATSNSPLVNITRTLDPHRQIPLTILTGRATKIVAIVEAASPATVRAMINFDA